MKGHGRRGDLVASRRRVPHELLEHAARLVEPVPVHQPEAGRERGWIDPGVSVVPVDQWRDNVWIDRAAGERLAQQAHPLCGRDAIAVPGGSASSVARIAAASDALAPSVFIVSEASASCTSACRSTSPAASSSAHSSTRNGGARLLRLREPHEHSRPLRPRRGVVDERLEQGARRRDVTGQQVPLAAPAAGVPSPEGTAAESGAPRPRRAPPQHPARRERRRPPRPRRSRRDRGARPVPRGRGAARARHRRRATRAWRGARRVEARPGHRPRP